MLVQEISTDNAIKEAEIQQTIFRQVDKHENFVFNAGAGAGKTYSLIESLKYVIKKFGKELKYHNQKVICITYTNVAVQEVRGRLGNSALVTVSTIHETFWSLIKKFQKELLKIHLEKLNTELNRIKSELYDDSTSSKVLLSFRKLESSDREGFVGLALAGRDLYYNSYSYSAGDFRTAVGDFFSQYKGLLSNVEDFKKLVNSLLRLDDYNLCVEQILNKEKGYQAVRYDSKYNMDALHKMVISHDTILEYAFKAFDYYPIIRKLIIDSHPFIFVDEYQDTDPIVIKALSLLSTHSSKINQKFLVAYFGDKAQNIYDGGVGSDLFQIHENLFPIKKEFNRRSCVEIIKAINKIRDDDVVQKSIYENSSGGEVSFFFDSSQQDKMEVVKKFLEKTSRDWGLKSGDKLHCLVLTNRLVASLSGFGKLYGTVSKFPFYRRHYDKLNTQFLSKDFSKLGQAPHTLLRLLKLKKDFEDESTPISELLPAQLVSGMTLAELKKVINYFRSFSQLSFYDFCEAAYENHEEDPQIIETLASVVPLNYYSFRSLKNVFLESLYPNLVEEGESQALDSINELLNIDMIELNKWYDFINDAQKSDFIFHTYHGTKGREFEHVVIVMENDFGKKNKDTFSSFFKNVSLFDKLKGPELERHNKTKNLLYVSCSRSKKNLRIIYLDPISTFKNGIEYVFGKPIPYEV